MRQTELPYRVPDTRCAGLAVRVAASGCKTWDLAFRIRSSGKVRRISLGQFPDISLERARERANEITRAARSGRDLLEDERTAIVVTESRITVRQLISQYIRRRVLGRLRTADQIEGRLWRALDPILDYFAADVRRRDIRKLLDHVADQGCVREAEQRRLTIGTMFKWALSQDFVETNPAAGLSTYGRGQERERVLAEDEIATVWRWLRASDLPELYTEIMMLQLLTGARCGEIAGLHAGEIDRSNWIWTLPAERSKNGRQRITPLVGMAREILDARISITGSGNLYVAKTGAVLGATHLGNCLNNRRRTLPVPKFTTHDLRRTVVTMLADMGFSLELVAAIIGHEMGGPEVRTLVRHYVRTDFVSQKAKALRAWDERLKDIIGLNEQPEVIELRKAS